MTSAIYDGGKRPSYARTRDGPMLCRGRVTIIHGFMLRSRASFFRWLRVAAAGGFVVWLAARAGVEAIARQLSEIDLALLAAALALLFADTSRKPGTGAS